MYPTCDQLCHAEAIIKQRPTGDLDKEVKVKAFNVQEYLHHSPAAQGMLEGLFLLATGLHIAGEVQEAKTFRDHLVRRAVESAMPQSPPSQLPCRARPASLYSACTQPVLSLY